MENPLKKKNFLAVQRNELDQFLLHRLVDLAALEARIDERSYPDSGQGAGFTRGDVPIEMGNDAFREVVSLDLVFDRQFFDARDQSVVAPDDALQQSFIPEPIEAPVFPVPDAPRINQCEVSWRLLVLEALFQPFQEFLGNAIRAVSRYRDRVAILNERDGVIDRHNFCHGHHLSGGDDTKTFRPDEAGDRREAVSPGGELISVSREGRARLIGRPARRSRHG